MFGYAKMYLCKFQELLSNENKRVVMRFSISNDSRLDLLLFC